MRQVSNQTTEKAAALCYTLVKSQKLKLAVILPSIFGWLLSGCQTTQETRVFSISNEAFRGSNEKFLPQENYLAMALPYPPMRSLFEHLSARSEIGILRSRGEAHITVITPPEYQVLREKMSIMQINQIAQELSLQATKIEPICIGVGRAMVDKKEEQTFYVIVKAPALIELRQKVAQLFVDQGGRAESFNAGHYFPHITVGFSKVDLHENQGVIKDQASCRYLIAIQ